MAPLCVVSVSPCSRSNWHFDKHRMSLSLAHGREMAEEEGTSFKLFGTVIQKGDGRAKEGEKEEEAPPQLPERMEALPCPRCKSRDTKFCYFNNYNVNQPRHLCRTCHRYWTAGGTLRDVPVGAGRRRGRLGPRGGAAAS
ncbi:dof zinc finger protein DOF1.5-like [Zingiber officinale]|uniref:Dof-type domain-containing protein n=1 Tax=Zingiber officinale TaxID=94328 RepID=A0A8J5FX73_ZINOF|nr:dof zinc finger protein DOF1.5-like [Zingiber officinale]KAG6492147.1 hypothetical protein ZIOFF_047097 [Zingiber officinale]